MYDVTLAVKDLHDIEASLRNYTKEEHADDYTCEQCGKQGGVTRRTSFHNTADFLMLSLTRYEYDMRTYQRKKVHTKVSFPLELDMDAYFEDRPSGLEAMDTTPTTTTTTTTTTRTTTTTPGRRRRGGPGGSMTTSFAAEHHDQDQHNHHKGVGTTTPPHPSAPFEDREYELTAILVHRGSEASMGHYVAHIRQPPEFSGSKVRTRTHTLTHTYTHTHTHTHTFTHTTPIPIIHIPSPTPHIYP